MYGLDASSFDYAGVPICGLLNACRLRASKSHALDVKCANTGVEWRSAVKLCEARGQRSLKLGMELAGKLWKLSEVS